MNTYTCILKLKEASPKYGCQERQIKVQNVSIHCAKREVEFQYPDYEILKIRKVNFESSI